MSVASIAPDRRVARFSVYPPLRELRSRLILLIWHHARAVFGRRVFMLLFSRRRRRLASCATGGLSFGRTAGTARRRHGRIAVALTPVAFTK